MDIRNERETMKLTREIFFGLVAGVVIFQLLLVFMGVFPFGGKESSGIGLLNMLVLVYFGYWLGKNKSGWKEAAKNGATAGAISMMALTIFVFISRMIGRPILGISASTEALLLILAIIYAVNIALAVVATVAGAFIAGLKLK